MSIFESIERHPAEYLPSGDKALLVAWAILPSQGTGGPIGPEVLAVHAILCLEDGRVVAAQLPDIKFDYRFDVTGDRWVDVSRVLGPDSSREDTHGNPDQEDADDGSPSVPGSVPDPD